MMTVSTCSEVYRLDEKALIKWLQAHVPHFSGPLSIVRFPGGQSNPTYKLITPSRIYVLRRKPSGLLLKGAHAIEREARVLVGLATAGFPVPKVEGICTDEGIIGTSFYIMEMVEGRIYWDASLPDVPREQRAAYFDAMNVTIAQLHMVDYRLAGLGGFGRPGNYFQRQITRWTAQYLADEQAGRDANMDQLIAWLPQNIPPGEETCIVHGDFRVDNLIFDKVKPQVVAVLDWELSTLGHPLADFTYLTMMYHMPPHIVAGLAGANLNALNIPTEDEYVAAYCERTGRAGIAHYPYYQAFNLFRLASIFHGIKGRVIRGTASSAQAAERAEAFPELARMAWARANGM